MPRKIVKWLSAIGYRLSVKMAIGYRLSVKMAIGYRLSAVGGMVVGYWLLVVGKRVSLNH